MALAHAHLIIDEREFGAGVGAKNFAGVLRFPDHNSLPRSAHNLRHVGEVVLRVGIGSREPFDVLKQSWYVEDVEAGIDLVNVSLDGARGFLFDDGLDFGAAGTLPQHAAVACGVVELSAEQCHRGLLVEVEVEQLGNGLGRDLRGVAG